MKSNTLDTERSTSSVIPTVEKVNSSHQSTGGVQMRIKSSIINGDRLSQTKSMILNDTSKDTKPISRHRRNHSQHNLTDITGKEDQPKVKKEGNLNKTKIAEGGKKIRKNWTTSWVVLQGQKLEIFKEPKQQTLANLKSGCKPESLDLGGAQIEWTKEKSSRKNVFQVTTESGSEFLFQFDDDSIVFEWYQAIKNAIENMPRDKSYSAKGFGLLGFRKSSSSELLDRCGVESPSKEHKSDHRKSLILKLNYSASDSSDIKRVKSRLKKFISRRPSMKTLQEKGLIKDQVFGCHFETLCNREGTTVPSFVKVCIDAVEKRGLEVDGIYRVSGNLATIQKLRFAVDHEEKLNLDDSQWEDIHVVTGALKMFFRELPEPLFPYYSFERFVDAIKIQNHKSRVQSIKNLIEKLPRPNHDTMKILFGHLRKIVAKASVNLMSTQSLGIVFGPTLLRPERETGNMPVYMVYQNQIVELILIEYHEIFGSED
ncbi:rho GTPase-activating protein 15 [Latimeria chalumnae]|nr:PREDICTED: rho GTPase-activating protein 15 [Latimeria chalumnae]|eukprot:XP_006005331.1 PREDICTED: rho GTPase-activating protein 15 [Latimeria chalumnae]